jgi:phosphoribosyl 1,2-cyclic phosphate phosphodiesterase
MRRTIDIYMSEVTSALMRDRFRYIFEMLPGSGYPPILIGHVIAPFRPFTVDGAGGPLDILPLEVAHGEIMALALKVGDAVYMPDVSSIPADVEPHLAGLDLLILDALRPRPHPTHFSLPEALACIARTRPRRAVLTNLHTDLDHGELIASLPEGIMPAHDGLALAFADEPARAG